MCAAAFVQNRKSYTGCTDAPNPSGESGRSWCYVEAQVISIAALASILHLRCMKLLEATSAESAWNFCAPVVDYNGLRKEVAAAFADKVGEVQGLVAKLQKNTASCGAGFGQVRASCTGPQRLTNVVPHACRYEKTCTS